MSIVDNLIWRYKGFVYKVVGFNPRHGNGHMGVGKTLDYLIVTRESGAASLPDGPGFSRGHALKVIVSGEATIKGCDHIAALALWYHLAVLLPVLGEDTAGTVLIEPVNIFVAT